LFPTSCEGWSLVSTSEELLSHRAELPLRLGSAGRSRRAESSSPRTSVVLSGRARSRFGSGEGRRASRKRERGGRRRLRALRKIIDFNNQFKFGL
jgi:hypothetical protein